ncbi:MAG TPA: hypothetical protein VFV96_04465 [Verrucomicrobiae bacterium]|nr:hypothetical protein [Verrucomicrobiae bacterium]
MENNNDNFEQLRRLMALKRHEVPPPGYFHAFSGHVIARLRAGQGQRRGQWSWLNQMWETLQGRPAFAGVFGAGVCALILIGVFAAEEPSTPPELVHSPAIQASSPFLAVTPVAAEAGLTSQVELSSTNPTVNAAPNLFDMVQPYQAMPVSATPQP